MQLQCLTIKCNNSVTAMELGFWMRDLWKTLNENTYINKFRQKNSTLRPKCNIFFFLSTTEFQIHKCSEKGQRIRGIGFLIFYVRSLYY